MPNPSNSDLVGEANAQDPMTRETALALIEDAQRWQKAYCTERDTNAELAQQLEQAEQKARHYEILYRQMADDAALTTPDPSTEQEEG